MDRPRIDDRVAFTPIVFVLLTDVPWRMVPAAGVWERLHRELRRRLNAAGLIDWTRDRRFKPHSRSSRGSDRALAG